MAPVLSFWVVAAQLTRDNAFKEVLTLRLRIPPVFMALITIMFLAACGSAAAPPAATAVPVATKPAAAAPTSAPAATTAPEAATAPAAAPTTAPTTAPATVAKKLKVGMVTDIAKLGDKSFNDSAWNGTQAGAKDIGADVKVIETTDPNDYEKNINQFVSEGYNIIVTVGFALGEQTIKSGKANPKITFIGVDQFQADVTPNVIGLVFEEDKSGFLAGALAASYSKSGKLGDILGTDAVPPVWRFGEGFRAGAKYINPSVDVQTVYHSDVGFDKTFDDPEWGKATALSMMDKGVDVVFGAGGRTGNGALFAAADRKDKGVTAIGVDTDQYNTVPEAKPILLSSAVKIIDQGVEDLIKQAAAGTLKGGNVTGKVGLAPFHEFDSKISADVKAKLDDIRKKLDDGTLKTNVAPVKPK